jgi:death on curing protein
MAPRFLGLAEVVAIHHDQITRYGGGPGLRDVGGLAAALAMPAAGVGAQYLHEDLFAMAAAYLFHIARGHPFVDGNKRAGAVAALVFLDLNGIVIEADESEFERLVRAAATGCTDKAAIAVFLRAHANR